jgi:hypothetical protein
MKYEFPKVLCLMTLPNKNNVIAEREQMCGYEDQGDRFVVSRLEIE